MPSQDRGISIRNSRASCSAASTVGAMPPCGLGLGGVGLDQRAKLAGARDQIAGDRHVVIVGGDNSFQHPVGFLAAVILAQSTGRSMPALLALTPARAIAITPQLCDKRDGIRTTKHRGLQWVNLR